MAYSHTSLSTLKNRLANRLDDSGKVYFVDDELGTYIHESLRVWGVLSGFWRERATFSTVSGTAWYDLMTQASSLAGSAVTDRDLIKTVQYALCEPVSSQTSWPGTEMFAYDDIVQAITQRRNQFLQDTGIVLTRTIADAVPPPVGRLVLPDTVIDLRRAAWVDGDSRYFHLWREDERALTGYKVSWSTNPEAPYAFSVMATRPLEMQIAPPPRFNGRIETITVSTGAALDPATSATALGIPDSLVWILKWGVLADLLGKDGRARDPGRSSFCETRYKQGVALARMLPLVVHAEIQGKATIPDTVHSLDSSILNWQNKSGAPINIGLMGWNLLAVEPVPDGVYSVTVDLVRNAPIPADSEFVQVGREQLDSILDYAFHLAMFKVGGAEFMATSRQAENFLLEAITYNQRLSASARYVIAPREASRAEEFARPRRLVKVALGTAPEEVSANA